MLFELTVSVRAVAPILLAGSFGNVLLSSVSYVLSSPAPTPVSTDTWMIFLNKIHSFLFLGKEELINIKYDRRFDYIRWWKLYYSQLTNTPSLLLKTFTISSETLKNCDIAHIHTSQHTCISVFYTVNKHTYTSSVHFKVYIKVLYYYF